jgi:hypothetical protein
MVCNSKYCQHLDENVDCCKDCCLEVLDNIINKCPYCNLEFGFECGLFYKKDMSFEEELIFINHQWDPTKYISTDNGIGGVCLKADCQK